MRQPGCGRFEWIEEERRKSKKWLWNLVPNVN
jgi:hypothetical protein